MAAEDGLLLCSVPQFLGAGNTCKWEVHALTYSVTASLQGLSDHEWLEAIKLALSFWSDVANISFTYTDNASEADILIATGKIDGPSGVLAWSEMPCGSSDPAVLHQRYDAGEMQWIVSEHPNPGELDICRVIAHEIGHACGIPHFPQNALALLAPTYSTSIRRPQALDVAAMQARYGPPSSEPPPTIPPPIPAKKRLITVEGEGAIVRIDGKVV